MARAKDLWLTRDRRRTAKYGRGKRWLAVWIADGAEHGLAFDRKIDAERYAAAMESDQLRGVYIDPRKGAQLLREYGEGKFMPSLVHLRPNSVDSYESHLRTHIYPALGGRQIGSLSRSDIKAFVASVSRQLAPSSTGNVYAVLRALMTAAVDDGVIPVNPCSRISLPEVTPHVLVPLEPEQVLALAGALSPRYRVSVALAAGAGLRLGEATGLTLPRVEFLKRRLQVIEQVQNGALAPLKSKASRRTVPVGAWVLGEISAHLERFGTGPGQLVMSNVRGQVIRRTGFGQTWRRGVAAARTCGKPPAEAGQRSQECRDSCADPAHMLPAGTRFHDLRHFYASAMIASNINPKVIQTRLGHATIRETMDTYGHLFPDSEELGRAAVDDALAGALAEQERNRSAR